MGNVNLKTVIPQIKLFISFKFFFTDILWKSGIKQTYKKYSDRVTPSHVSATCNVKMICYFNWRTNFCYTNLKE